ncbi:hypothetical protein WH240_11425 [Gluconobacter wancherniae]|uniref:hypothetical protein n=1 Tax=Gluconobacter wancherniae TaxID=1307955 RepID=UPI0030A0C339
MKREDNEAARDLWSQMFNRMATHPGAAVVDPEYDPREDEARTHAAFAAAGWREDEIDAILASSKERNAKAPSTSPGANPSAEALHAVLCDDIEAEMARQGLETQKNVARGIEPITGPFASKAGVIMTEQSIITIGAFTFRFCGLIAKAFYRTIMLDPTYWQSDQFTTEFANLLLRRNMPLALYWNRIFMSFAMSGTNITVPFEPSDPTQVLLVEQVARAMELFVVAHEYGHHHHGHGRDANADARIEEFEADQFSLRIGRPIGERDRTPIWNPYLASGSGGVVVLKALETLRRFEHALGAPMPRGNTHPSADERIAHFDSVAVLEPVIFKTLKGFRIASLRVMDTVESLLDDFLAVIPEDDRGRLAAMRRELWEQLPKP